MTDSARDAIIAMAIVTPLGLGLWFYGRWREDDLQPRRDLLVVVGTISGVLIVAAALAGPPLAASFVLPIALLVGGIWSWTFRPSHGFERFGAGVFIVLGVIGLISGALRLALG
jgi:hypothetical protein